MHNYVIIIMNFKKKETIHYSGAHFYFLANNHKTRRNRFLAGNSQLSDSRT